MSNPLLEYIAKKQQTSNKHLLYNKIEVESLIGGVPINYIISNIERSIPEYFFNGIEKIIIGNFRDNKDNRSFYEDSIIYVSINNKEDIERDISHELCHFLFEKYSFFEDVLVHEEFMGKRRRLFDILNYSGYNPSEDLFASSDFNQRLDDYLHNSIGYKKLTSHIIGLFPDPYSVTSLQEYVSTCFEFFFVKDRDYIKKICPATYKLLMHLIGKNGKLYFVLRT
jgi:hypothetical protein